MTSEQIRQRSDILGTQVITRSTGRRLGVISQLWVDIDRREVVAMGMRESMLSGVLSNTQQMMLLSSIRQIGDVILVDDDTVLEEDLNVEAYSTLINCEVITETGELLGKVRGFRFNASNGKLMSLVIASIGIPLIPDQVVSTYELSIEEVVSSGPDRLIVFEGSEDKLTQLTVGLLERLGIGRPPWEREGEDDYYVMPASPANQLGTGARTTPQPLQTVAPVRERERETWDDDTWEEERRPLREPLRQREPEPIYYDDREEENWGDAEGDYGYMEMEVPREEEEVPYVEYRQAEIETSADEGGDPWEDDENPKPYEAPEINLPERKRVVEYEEETDY